MKKENVIENLIIAAFLLSLCIFPSVSTWFFGNFAIAIVIIILLLIGLIMYLVMNTKKKKNRKLEQKSYYTQEKDMIVTGVIETAEAKQDENGLLYLYWLIRFNRGDIEVSNVYHSVWELEDDLQQFHMEYPPDSKIKLLSKGVNINEVEIVNNYVQLECDGKFMIPQMEKNIQMDALEEKDTTDLEEGEKTPTSDLLIEPVHQYVATGNANATLGHSKPKFQVSYDDSYFNSDEPAPAYAEQTKAKSNHKQVPSMQASETRSVKPKKKAIPRSAVPYEKGQATNKKAVEYSAAAQRNKTVKTKPDFEPLYNNSIKNDNKSLHSKPKNETQQDSLEEILAQVRKKRARNSDAAAIKQKRKKTYEEYDSISNLEAFEKVKKMREIRKNLE